MATNEQTGMQSISAQPGESGVEEFALTRPVTYDYYRIMRRQPTIAMARALRIAPILAAEWSIESDDEVSDDVVQFVSDQILPKRRKLLVSALRGMNDFGWAPFEIVWQQQEGAIGIEKVKPLLHDMTTVLFEKSNGAFAGYKQGEQTIDTSACLHFVIDMEGANWYGESQLERARFAYAKWLEVERRAAKYDRKIAGTNIVVYYPQGTTIQADGSRKENHEIAKDVLAALETAGGIVAPRPSVEQRSGLDEKMLTLGSWGIDYVGDTQAKQISFIPRFRYLDLMMIRAMLWPERAIIEGQYGNKAEAGVHADLAVTAMELQHDDATTTVNEQVVDPLLVLNYGEQAAGTVRCVASPLVDEKLVWLREVFKSAWADASGLMQLIGAVDFDALMDTLKIPKSQEVVDVGNEPMPGLEPGQIEQMP